SQQHVSKEDVEDSHFQQNLAEWGKRPEPENGIPKFFNKIPKESEPLRLKLREESRSNLLKRKSLQLLDNNELKELWVLLDQNQSYPDEQLITYADFQKVAQLAGPKVKAYFTAVVFARLQQGDPQGRVSIMSLFNYVMHKVWLDQTRIGLSLYDATGQGYLTEGDLENYITDLLPTLPQLEGLEKSFHSFYVCTAVRKFLFFLDVVRAGGADEELSKELQEQNWFSAPSALRIYGHYLNLDRDHNGMLSKSELARYGTGTLTKPFLDRVFQTCLTYGGEMDYKTYLDLVLALENRSEPQALAYIFNILDLKNCGYLDAFTLNYFFRAIQDQMKQHGAEPVSFQDVKDELFDMVRPKDPETITLADLLACGQGDTFVSILIEFHGFWAYENQPEIQYKYKNIVDNTQDEPGDSICCKQKKRFWILLRMILQRVLEKLHVRNRTYNTSYRRIDKEKESGSENDEETELFVRNKPQRKEIPSIEKVMEDGDTLQSLAVRYHCTISDLKRLNNIHKENEIFAKRTIKVPHRPFTMALAGVHISGASSPNALDHPSTSKLIDIESFNTQLTANLLQIPKNKKDKSVVNEIIFNSNIQPCERLIEEVFEDTGCEEVRLLPQQESELPQAEAVVSALNCSGADGDISWVALIVCIVIVAFAIPLIYVLYIAEHPDQYHHHVS
ncbi:hypothetical protein NQ317_000148, partial [Molorchus minor]